MRYGYGSKMRHMLGGAFDFSGIVNSLVRKGSLNGNKWVSDVCTGHAAIIH